MGRQAMALAGPLHRITWEEGLGYQRKELRLNVLISLVICLTVRPRPLIMWRSGGQAGKEECWLTKVRIADDKTAAGVGAQHARP
ncbi:hypothetical protein VTH82DRAFT_837 [Thermothelomyces myriococcoides]